MILILQLPKSFPANLAGIEINSFQSKSEQYNVIKILGD